MNRSEPASEGPLPRTAEAPEHPPIPEESERSREKTQPMPMTWRRPAEAAR